VTRKRPGRNREAISNDVGTLALDQRPCNGYVFGTSGPRPYGQRLTKVSQLVIVVVRGFFGAEKGKQVEDFLFGKIVQKSVGHHGNRRDLLGLDFRFVDDHGLILICDLKLQLSFVLFNRDA